MSVRRLPPWLPAVAIALVCVVDLAWPRPHAPPSTRGVGSAPSTPSLPRPLSAEERARLSKIRDGLDRGTTLGAFTVTEVVDADPQRPIVMVVTGQGMSFEITVAPIGLLPHSSPETTRWHALFYRGSGAESSPVTTARAAALAAVAVRVRERE